MRGAWGRRSGMASPGGAGTTGRIVELLRHERVPLVAVVLGVLLALPALGVGLLADDYVLRSKLLELEPLERGPLLDLFAFLPGTPQSLDLLRDHGLVPWWTHPEVRASFLRPLSAATHVLDHWIWPDGVVAQHAHSLAWYALAVWLVARLYRRCAASPEAAGLAALMFAIEDAHAVPVGWLANRNALVALVLGVTAVLCHLRWRERGGKASLGLAVAAAAASLAAGEAALGALAYVVAWEVTLAPGGWRRRVLAVTPYVLLVAAWRLVYDALGYGAAHSGLYVDPAGEPSAFLRALTERAPVLVTAQWLQAPADLWMFLPHGAQLAWSAVGLAALAGLWWLVSPVLRTRATARFWALGMLLGLVPLCAAFPMSRLLTFSGIGAFGLLAEAGLGWWPRSGDRGERPRQWLRTRIGGAVVGLHLLLPLVLFPATILGTARLMSLFRLGADLAPRGERVGEQTFVFVNGSDLVVAYAGVIRVVEGDSPPRRVALLSSFLSSSELSRVDARTLVIRPDEGFLAYPMDQLMRRGDYPFERGERVVTSDFTAEVRDVLPDGRAASVAFVFEQELEDVSYVWLAWVDGELVAWTPPAVGAASRIEGSLPRL